MLPRRVLGDADVGIADFARVYGSGHGHQQLRASESGQFAAVVQLGLVIVAMDTTESVPLVEAAIVSVLPVNIDLNELHPRGTGELAAPYEESRTYALDSHRRHDVKLVKQGDGRVIPDVGA